MQVFLFDLKLANMREHIFWGDKKWIFFSLFIELNSASTCIFALMYLLILQMKVFFFFSNDSSVQSSFIKSGKKKKYEKRLIHVFARCINNK